MAFQIADLFEIVVDTIPNDEALYDEKHRLTYKQLDERANQLAHYWQSLGIGKGDHIGLYLYNCAEYIEAMLAACKLSATTININYRYVDEELRYLLDDADVTALIYQRELAPIVERVLPNTPLVKHTMYVDDASGESLDGIAGTVEYESAVVSQSKERDFPERSNDDLFIVYTGGTTGMPKGVLWRQEDLFFAGLQGGRPQGDNIETPEELAEVVKAGEMNGVFFPAPPLIHGTSQFATLIALFAGGKVVLSRNKSFKPDEFCRLVDQEDVNIAVLIGDAMCRPFLDHLRENPGKYDMDSLMVMTSQSAIISRSTIAGFEELLPNVMILNNFGASETGHQGQAIGENDEEGRPMFFMDESTLIIDDDGNIVEPGSDKVGRLARSGYIPLGYYKDEEKTARTFMTINGVRYVIPGDYAKVDEEGIVSLLGRGSVCINTGGEKVYPEEVEEAIKDHAAIEDVLVIGVPDDRWGQRVVAIIQLKDGQSVDGPQLKEHLTPLIGRYKIPKDWHFVDLVVRQPSGKPDYKWAKEFALEHA